MDVSARPNTAPQPAAAKDTEHLWNRPGATDSQAALSRTRAQPSRFRRLRVSIVAHTERPCSRLLNGPRQSLPDTTEPRKIQSTTRASASSAPSAARSAATGHPPPPTASASLTASTSLTTDPDGLRD